MSILDVLKLAPRAADDGARALYPILFQTAGGMPAMARGAVRPPRMALQALGAHDEMALPLGLGAASSAAAAGLPALIEALTAQDPWRSLSDAEARQREIEAAVWAYRNGVR